MGSEIIIRPATDEDAAAIWRIHQEVIADGTAFMADDRVSREEIVTAWLSPPAVAFIACAGETLLGAYLIKPNYPGRGAHVANATYMVARAARGQGIGRRLGEHSLAQARDLGYRAMQFNAVVSTNEAAVRLWRDLGFAVIGTVPEGFAHPTQGLVALYIMHRFL